MSYRILWTYLDRAALDCPAVKAQAPLRSDGLAQQQVMFLAIYQAGHRNGSFEREQEREGSILNHYQHGGPNHFPDAYTDIRDAHAATVRIAAENAAQGRVAYINRPLPPSSRVRIRRIVEGET